MIRRAAAVVAFIAFAAFSVWYSSSEEPLAPTSTPSASSTSTSPPLSQPSISPSPVAPGAVEDQDGAGTPVPATATATADTPTARARQAQAAGAAEDFMRAFAEPGPGVSPDQWWARVESLLSPRAVQDYAGTSPRSTGFTRLTGAAAVIPTEGPADLLTAVMVPTDGGTWRVELERDESGSYLVTRAITPDEAAIAP